MRALLAGAFMMAVLCVANVARADIADQRTTELLSALQAGNFTEAEAHFDATTKAGLAPEKLGKVWNQLTSELGPLQSFEVTGRTSVGGNDVRIADLHFAHASGWIAQVGVNSAGLVSGLWFKPAEAEKPSADAQKLADDRVNEMLGAIRDGKFDAAEEHFDAAMKSAFPPSALEAAWTPRTESLGGLKVWRIVGRSDAGGGVLLRIVNLDFATTPKAFALRIAIDPNGDIGGFFFVEAVAEPVSSVAPYIRAASFTSREAKVGSGQDALGATLTIPVGGGPFPGVVLVHGSGANDRDEDVAANHPFKDLAEGLSSDGIVVLRHDKRTYAHRAEFHTFTVDAEVIDDAVAAVALLRRQPEVNRDKLFVLGHSLGAGLAPEIAARSHADGVVMLAPPGLPMPETIVRQFHYLNAPPAKIAATEKTAHLIMAKALPPDEFFLGMPASYYYDLASHDEVGFARKLGKPILIVCGDRDYQVAEEDIAVWRNGLKDAPNVSIETMPRLNHLFIAGDGKPGPDEYSIPGYVAPEVIARVANFIKS
jgi:dienelactone hydrolase